MTNFKIFENPEFGEFFIYEDNERFEIEATNCAKVLGYSNPRDAILRHCRCVVKHDVPHPQNSNKTIEKSFISEGDLYRLIVHSKLPSAERFEKWIFDEVLPNIRQNGGYVMGQENLLTGQMTKEEFFAKAVKMAESTLADYDKRIKELLVIGEQQKEEIAAKNEIITKQKEELIIHKERSKYFEEIIKQPASLPLDKIVSDYAIGAPTMNKILYILGVIKGRGQGYNGANDWQITTKFSTLGITTMVQNGTYFDKNKIERARMYMYWNQRGRFFIYMIMKNIGIKPIIERNSSDEELALETLKEFNRIWKISNKGKDSIFFRDLKDRIKEGFKIGNKEFVRNLKEGNIDELIGDKSCNIKDIVESDYDMIEFYDKKSREEEWKERDRMWRRGRE